jgi:hypothetical protein
VDPHTHESALFLAVAHLGSRSAWIRFDVAHLGSGSAWIRFDVALLGSGSALAI